MQQQLTGCKQIPTQKSKIKEQSNCRARRAAARMFSCCSVMSVHRFGSALGQQASHCHALGSYISKQPQTQQSYRSSSRNGSTWKLDECTLPLTAHTVATLLLSCTS